MITESAVDELLRCMISSERGDARELVDAWLHTGHAPESFITEVLSPALVQVGARWSKQRVSLSQTFVAAKIAEETLLRCAPPSCPPMKASRGRIVLGNIEDDFHGLGRRIVGTFLRSSGWTVHDLGNDVPAEDFVTSAVELDAPLIGVSAMMHTTALGIRRVRRLIDEQGLGSRVRLVVGGAVFGARPELAEEVGADGMAKSAHLADALFTRLQSEVRGGGR